MKYKIEKTSCWKNNDQPYSQAYQEGCDSFGEPIWFVNVETLEQIQDIIKETGHPVIISKDSIEIYDDYRE